MTLSREVAVAADPASVMLAEGLTPDDWQRDVLDDQESFWLLLCSRQSGKTACCAAVALATAMTDPGALVLIVAPSLRQSQEAFRQVAQMYLAVHGGVLDADTLTSMRLELRNRSRVVVIPGDGDARIRGFSGVKLIVADEAARIPDDVLHALMPTLAASRGRMIAASTPWFERGWFHRQWTEGGDDWRRVTVTANQCPRIDPAFLERERRDKPGHWFRQEYECTWGAAGEMLFPWEIIDRITDATVVPYAPDRTRFA
jgi:hypothetical protein